MNIDEKELKRLNKEQNQIILSDAKKMIVSAGPGSGKTFTIVKKVTRELESLDEQEGVIVCSFTKEASTQLTKKITNQEDIKSSFIGTIDSFVLQCIIDPFKNRFLEQNGHKKLTDKIKIRMPKMNSKSNELTKKGISKDTTPEILVYCKEWLDNFKKGIYEISFPTYLVAKKMLNEMSVLSNYIDCKYTTIYIDEAQDLNEFQHIFLETLIVKCNLKSVLIGDKNQSSYEFRGARPEQFYNLKEKGYIEYKITISVRCHKSILDFSNLIIDSSYNVSNSNDCKVNLDISPTLQNVEKVEGNFMILFESNDNAFVCYQYFKKLGDIEVIYTKKIELLDKEFSDNYLNLIEECIKFKVNIINENPKLTYSLEDFELFLSNDFIVTSKIRKVILDIEKDFYHYIINILKVLSIELDENTRKELKEQLSDDMYLNHYKNFENINRILTIHSSKGLEADNVFVRLEFLQYRITDEYRRKLFVAFSRAKNNLYISYKNVHINDTEIDRLLRKNLNQIM